MAPEGKIKSKDLTYDSALPPFLQRLHDQKAGRGGDQDRHERPIARPRGAKKNGHDDEDEPTVVDESGDMVSREEFEKMRDGEKGAEDRETDLNALSTVPDDAGPRAGGTVVDGIGMKKRKIAKVVGDGDKDGSEKVGNGGKDEEALNGLTKKPAKKVKKKVKPITLAFDNEDDT